VSRQPKPSSQSRLALCSPGHHSPSHTFLLYVTLQDVV
jgi:hypothetical protein